MHGMRNKNLFADFLFDNFCSIIDSEFSNYEKQLNFDYLRYSQYLKSDMKQLMLDKFQKIDNGFCFYVFYNISDISYHMSLIKYKNSIVLIRTTSTDENGAAYGMGEYIPYLFDLNKSRSIAEEDCWSIPYTMNRDSIIRVSNSVRIDFKLERWFKKPVKNLGDMYEVLLTGDVSI